MQNEIQIAQPKPLLAQGSEDCVPRTNLSHIRVESTSYCSYLIKVQFPFSDAVLSWPMQASAISFLWHFHCKFTGFTSCLFFSTSALSVWRYFHCKKCVHCVTNESSSSSSILVSILRLLLRLLQHQQQSPMMMMHCVEQIFCTF